MKVAALEVDEVAGGVRQAVYFFFQAEDGIRDLTVTGVQTCALPISLQPAQVPAARQRDDAGLRHLERAGGRSARCWAERLELAHQDQDGERGRSNAVRSEERRVGKEWRSR